MISRNATLLVIDVQRAFDDPRMGPRNNPSAEENIACLLAAWRETGRPVIHVKHDSTFSSSLFRPGQSGNDLKDEAKPLPGEPLLVKHVNSAFIGTDLEKRLRHAKVREVVIVGMATDHCISTTVRMGANLGFECYVVSDATATFDRKGPSGQLFPAEIIHETALASLSGEFATVLDTSRILEMVRVPPTG